MGIRFRCPSCQERLNVKQSNAGKRGVCPHCERKLLVPEKSQNKDRSATESAPMAHAPQTLPTKATAETSDSDSAGFNRSQLADSSSDFLCGQPSSASNENYIDPILEAPHRVWHLRDASQTESGPFDARKMRTMIDSGQVTANDFVCREDWQDWVPASDAFPQLGTPQTQIPIASQSVFTNPSYAISGEMTAKAKRARKQRQQKVFGIWLCVVGLLIIIALCYLLISLI